ncbi:helicase HerA domain-containing protein, partial [Bordetella pseudohinzii]
METGEILLGIDDWKYTKEKTRVPIFWVEDRVINHHVGVAGTSGAGKTHWIRKFVQGMPPHVEIDLFDYHGDIEIPGAQSVVFSEATRYGYNPLVLNPDPHYGGVRRGISDVLNAMTQTGRVLGGNQEGVLRNLLTDTYAARGILQDEPQSWKRREATQEEIRALQLAQDWGTLRATYPTLEDVIR